MNASFIGEWNDARRTASWSAAIGKVLIVGVTLFAATPSIARTFGGYECTVDCSGHKAGYEWAEARGITDEARCEAILRRWPNRNSFYEGCLVYVEDPARGADEDDDGDEID